MATPPKIYTCDEWGAVAPTGTIRKSTPSGIVIHNTESPNRAPLAGQAELNKAFELARSIQHDHMNRVPPKAPGIDTLQNFTVSRGGIILEGRHESLAQSMAGKMVWGGHTKSTECNKFGQGIEIEGNYVGQTLSHVISAVQIDAVVELIAWLAHWGDFDTANIKPHLACSPTDCPGNLVDILDDFKQRAHDRKVQIRAENG